MNGGDVTIEKGKKKREGKTANELE